MTTPYSSLRNRLGVPQQTLRGVAGEALVAGDTVYSTEGLWYKIAASDAQGVVTSATIAAAAAGNIKTYGAFSDTELDEIWAKVIDAATDIDREYAALAEMALRLRNGAAKLHNYTLGSNSEQLAQVFAHLDKIYAEYKPYLDKALGVKTRQLVMKTVAKRNEGKEFPYA